MGTGPTVVVILVLALLVIAVVFLIRSRNQATEADRASAGGLGAESSSESSQSTRKGNGRKEVVISLKDLEEARGKHDITDNSLKRYGANINSRPQFLRDTESESESSLEAPGRLTVGKLDASHIASIKPSYSTPDGKPLSGTGSGNSDRLDRSPLGLMAKAGPSTTSLTGRTRVVTIEGETTPFRRKRVDLEDITSSSHSSEHADEEVSTNSEQDRARRENRLSVGDDIR